MQRIEYTQTDEMTVTVNVTKDIRIRENAGNNEIPIGEVVQSAVVRDLLKNQGTLTAGNYRLTLLMVIQTTEEPEELPTTQAPGPNPLADLMQKHIQANDQNEVELGFAA